MVRIFDFEPDFSPTYHDMAEHYEAVVIPARVRKPSDKAKVEVGIRVVEHWILARLRNRTIFDLAQLNRAIRELLEELNNRVLRHRGIFRRELFEALNRPALKPLPAEPYQLAIWKKANVNIDQHVEFDKHCCSAPHQLIGQEVFMRATERTVEIFYKHRRVASHPPSLARGRYSNLSEHMPPNDRQYTEWFPELFLR